MNHLRQVVLRPQFRNNPPAGITGATRNSYLNAGIGYIVGDVAVHNIPYYS
jgi:hypothetical protein